MGKNCGDERNGKDVRNMQTLDARKDARADAQAVAGAVSPRTPVHVPSAAGLMRPVHAGYPGRCVGARRLALVHAGPKGGR